MTGLWFRFPMIFNRRQKILLNQTTLQTRLETPVSSELADEESSQAENAKHCKSYSAHKANFLNRFHFISCRSSRCPSGKACRRQSYRCRLNSAKVNPHFHLILSNAACVIPCMTWETSNGSTPSSFSLTSSKTSHHSNFRSGISDGYPQCPLPTS